MRMYNGAAITVVKLLSHVKRGCLLGVRLTYVKSYSDFKLSDMATVEELQLKINELERQLSRNAVVREKISNMSAEVVDSNPYR